MDKDSVLVFVAAIVIVIHFYLSYPISKYDYTKVGKYYLQSVKLSHMLPHVFSVK